MEMHARELRMFAGAIALLMVWSGGLSCVDAGRILGIVHFPARSHFVFFEKLFKELATRGHQVDVVSHFPQSTSVPNYRDITLKGSRPCALTVEYVTSKYFVSLIQNLWYNSVNTCIQAMENPTLKELVASDVRYDLVLVEIFGSDCTYGYGFKFGAPVIAITSLSGLPWANERVGNPGEPSYVPVCFLPFSSRMSFWQRLANTVGYIYTYLGEKWMSRFPSSDSMRKLMGEDVPPLEELLRNTSLVMVNSHFSIYGARPAVPGYVEIGGLHIDKNPGDIPKDLLAFLDGAGAEGVVLVTFGSLLRVETLPAEKLKAFVQVLGALPQRVVWKVDGTQMPGGVPHNVLAANWIPQQALLSHPKMRAFITHGGVSGTQEAVYWGVPMVVVPFFSDQRQNGLFLHERGAGRVVFYADLTTETLRQALHAVLNEPSYRENAKKLQVEFRDRPQTPMETAVFWTEYVMRHKGAPQLRSAAVDLAWYQLWLLDVAAALAAAAALLAVGLWLLARAIFRCLCPTTNSKQREIKKAKVKAS